MKKLPINKLASACATALLTSGLLLHVSPVMAATAAGTQIKNLATVTYQDASGNTYSAQSNEAIITVKQIYSAEIGSDTTKTAAAGQVVYSQHTLTNTGNGEDTYTFTAANVADGDLATNDNLTASSIKVYIDSNGNGLVDSGEQEATTLTLTAGQKVEVVMAVAVPNTATSGQTLGAVLKATSSNGTVKDITDAAGGRDLSTVLGTNHTWITVSTDAVLNYTKSAVLDTSNPALHKITYTLTVSNTGNATATSVELYDAIPASMTYVAGSITKSGLITANGDLEPVYNATLNETTIGIDLNKDTVMGTVAGIHATDASLASGATISMSFTASYDPTVFNNNTIAGSAGDIITNTAFLTANPGGTGGSVTVPSNPTKTVIPQLFGVKSTDTGESANDAVNDGKDDNAADDVQLVNSAPSGSTVLFNVKVTNQGTGRDTFELGTSSSSFPSGTVFTFWNADGTVQLVDTNGKGSLDTGMLEVGATTTIMVKAQLPAGATTGGSVTVTATSAGDPAATPKADTTTLQLAAVTAPGVDLYDDSAKAGSAANEDGLGVSPYNINNAPADAGNRLALAGVVGGTVNIPINIDNGSGSADSFQLSVGSVWNATTKTMGALPTGWSALFYKADSSGNPTGSPITSTSLLPAMSTGNKYVAVVTIPNNPAYAPADYFADNNGDGVPERMLANGDTDGDQPIFIRIKSDLSGANDIMLDAIDVASLPQVTLTPPGNNQIQPGGSVDYSNTLENSGNTAETLELTATDSLSANNWGNTVKVSVDTNGDGTPDVTKTLSELVNGDKIAGVDKEGKTVWIPVTGAADGKPDVTLQPGEKIDLTPTVYAPSNAAPGTTDVLTITATNKGTGPNATVNDASSVILGQVRLQKTVAYDQACDGTADGAFEASLTAKVAPGECAIWQIQAENQGDALAKNVVIRDTVPAYSNYKLSSMKYSLGTAAFTDLSDSVVDAGEIDISGGVTGNAITFYVGTSADPANKKGGDLESGNKATVQFSTKVQ
ncbi:beta strand repeat-containing protein [Thiothrix lacustris]|uniref:beta strand repeat-containing protein n=1 Tax=Thiothrix lacustris TaxID=525917 RepID=UPI0027E4B485|nr:hypothetical protein [Thiothrix lacustris]WMP19129.1 hypothetical protein RCS87_08695 [Thiothrix lacustris]